MLITRVFFALFISNQTINMTDYNRYEAELNSWYAEKSRQRVEFTIEREPSVILNYLSDLSAVAPSND